MNVRWLMDFADRWQLIYDDMIAEAMRGGTITANGVDLHSAAELGPDHDLFWKHLQELTGECFDEAHRKRFVWSCSC